MIPVKLGDLVVLTVRDPASALRILQAMGLPMSARWMLLLLSVILSTMLAVLSLMLIPVVPGDPVTAILADPMTLAGIQLVAMVASAIFVAQVGRMFGGHGTFPDALLVVAWVELLLVGLQAVQLLMMLLFPATASLMSMLALALFVYLAVAMTKALHGFVSTPKVVLGFVGSLFVLGFVLSLIAASFGIVPEVAP